MADENREVAPEAFDRRLYVPASVNWQAHVKRNWDKQYCFFKMPGQDFLHLIVEGEIFLQNGDEVACLTCALRRGIITTNRLHWQTRQSSTSIRIDLVE